MKLAIILTMYGNTEERLHMYTKNVKRWLDETSFDLYLVDSANRGVDISHPRLFQTIFQQEELKGRNITFYEVKSLIRLYSEYKYKLAKYDYLFKITCKYVVPNLEGYIPKDTTNDLIFQSCGSTKTRWQNSELVGIKSILLSKVLLILNEHCNNKHFENILPILVARGYTYAKLKPIPLDQKIPRSHGDILTYL